MATGRLVIITFVIQVCFHGAQGQRLTSIFTTSGSSTTTPRYPSNIIIPEDDRNLNFAGASVSNGGFTSSRQNPTSTTRRTTTVDRDYLESLYPVQDRRTTSTTRYPWTQETTTRNNYWDVTRVTTTTTSRPSEFDLYTRASAPAVNFSITDFKQNMLNVTWNATSHLALFSLKAVRQFTLIFSCNASYPVEWLCQTAFGTNIWDVEEIRHFENVRSTSNSIIFGPDAGSRKEAVYTAILSLYYDKSENVPVNLELNCARARRSQKFRLDWPMKRTLVNISKDPNATLYVNLKTENVHPRRNQNSGDTTSSDQYSEPLGKNVGCRVDLRWLEASLDDQSSRFECASDFNVVMDIVTDRCYDAASCERKYTNGKNLCWNENNRNSPPARKYPSDLWTEGSAPPSGVIICKRDDGTDNNDNTTDALHFVHSLPPICQEDRYGEALEYRQKLYVASEVGIPADPDILRDDFMSFCWTPRSYEKEMREWKVYAGENVTVSCIASIYHFARGVRIGVRRGGRSWEWYYEYARIADSTLLTPKSDGYFNFTAKVHIDRADVSGLFCETYLKQSEGSVRKMIPLNVTIPKNITFVGELQVTAWNYTGQRDFELRCEANGDPAPSLVWKRLGRDIPTVIEEMTWDSEDGGKISVLKFPSLEDDSSKTFSVAELQGTFTCEAISTLDRSTRTFLVSSNSSAIPAAPMIVEVDKEGGSGWVLWVVLPIFVIGVVAIILFLVWKIKMQSKELRLLSKAEVDEFIFGKPELIQHHSSSEEVNNYAPFLPYNRGYEIGKEQLEIDENGVLGSGAYAIVLRGTLTRKDGDRVRVAIKTARAMDDISFFKALLSELKIMGFIGTHPNIVNLVGAHTKNIQNREIFIAIEFCENGNLLSYLRDHRNRFTNLVGPAGDDFVPGSLENVSRDSFVSPANGLNTITLIKWAYEIANGMEFLSQKKVIHGDLAARNILLNEYLIAKIGDFGLSRQLFEYANYIKQQQSPLPWKWLAIECLQDMRFSVKSDVWAYGIMLFEIFSLGQVPYPGHSYNDEFLEALINGKRPNRPSHATNQIYSFMTTCWKDKSEDRPTFSQVREFFNKLLSKLVPQEYLDLHEKVTSTPPHPSNTLTVDVNPCLAAQTPKSSTLGSNSEGKQSRFSFNTKTITAVFHRGGN